MLASCHGASAGDRQLYGSALLAVLVGARGQVWGVEIDPALVERGQQIFAGLDDPGPATLRCADACDPSSWDFDAKAADKVTVGFALERLPSAWVSALAEGTVIVAPLRDPSDGELRLARAVHRGDGFTLEWFEAVSYVPVRAAVKHRPPAPVQAQVSVVRLPVLR